MAKPKLPGILVLYGCTQLVAPKSYLGGINDDGNSDAVLHGWPYDQHTQ
jgi:hypothetical protein